MPKGCWTEIPSVTHHTEGAGAEGGPISRKDSVAPEPKAQGNDLNRFPSKSRAPCPSGRVFRLKERGSKVVHTPIRSKCSAMVPTAPNLQSPNANSRAGF